ncbi:YebC/PmpR family DNA-binding transcriptional regulator [Candidatus Peregrinibacteria bacterium]|nr:YebC/PmpR family DNA-binding transcriptional regulator [Candidatus Peregrinibacteria bacterium]
MARHSHWASIRIKKGALDKKRGKIFTKHARLIEVAARQGGGDPVMNASLRLAIENARYENMPRENIDRAIKKGTGELKGGEIQEVSYEGYGPGGFALVIDTLTDNKNRTNQALRMALQKNGGTLGEAGCTSFMFEVKGELNVKKKGGVDEDEIEIIDAGAQDIAETEDGFIVYTAATDFGKVKKALEAKGYVITGAQLIKSPKNLVEITDAATAKKVLELMDALDEEEDVANVAANFDIPENLVS